MEMDTCPKNGGISFSRKGFCALGIVVKVKVRVRVSGDTFKYVNGKTSIRANVLDPVNSYL